ncbi:MAG: U32 family peptidase, partial [Desulfobacteraceae bacterium]|nr:U32 family peptidase [Desulfobacteraceae bacterium]
IQRVTRAVPKRGKFYLTKSPKGKTKKGTAVFIIDRKEKHLEGIIKKLDIQLSGFKKAEIKPVKAKSAFLHTRNLSPVKGRKKITDLTVTRGGRNKKNLRGESGTWISQNKYTVKTSKRDWLWLDPALFPGEDKQCRQFLSRAVKKGCRNFVLNAPWQISLFDTPKRLNIWAGPFCNITNSLTISQLKQYGFSGAIVSPELDKETLLDLPNVSPLPLGIILYGNWPLAVSRIISKDLKKDQSFSSPKGEAAWVSKFNQSYFVFPQWRLDLTPKKDELKKAGYLLFANLHEQIPRGIKMKDRPGLWNWNLKLL